MSPSGCRLAAVGHPEQRVEVSVDRGGDGVLRTPTVARAGHEHSRLVDRAEQEVRQWPHGLSLDHPCLHRCLEVGLYQTQPVVLADLAPPFSFFIQLGLLTGTMAAGNLAGALPAGRIVERWGMRNALLTAVIAAPALLCLRALSPAFSLQLALAFASGLALCLWAVSKSPILAAITGQRERPLAFSLVFSLGIGMGAARLQHPHRSKAHKDRQRGGECDDGSVVRLRGRQVCRDPGDPVLDHDLRPF